MNNKEDRKLDSVVYSFSARWNDALCSGSVHVFFRKRRPKTDPRFVFLYVGFPVKKIIGFAEVKSIAAIDLNRAIQLKDQAAIEEKELIKYIGPDSSVFAIQISGPKIFAKPFDLEALNQRFGFHPPQSFSKLNAEMFDHLTGSDQ